MNRISELRDQLEALDCSLAALADVLRPDPVEDFVDAHQRTPPCLGPVSIASAGDGGRSAARGFSRLFGLGVVAMVAISLLATTAVAWTDHAKGSYSAQSGTWASSSPTLCATHSLTYTPANTITGTAGIDFLVVSGTAGKLVLALGGIDFVAGGPGRDCIDGGDDNDLLKGFGGGDVILGGKGNDTIFGGDGNDVIDGGPGYDICVGGPGIDTITNCEKVYQANEDGGGDDGHCHEKDDLLAGGAGGGSGGHDDNDDDDCDDDDGHCRDSDDLQPEGAGGAGGGSGHDGGHDGCDSKGSSGGDGAKSAAVTNPEDPEATPSSADETPTPSATATPSPTAKAKATSTPTVTPTPTRTPTRAPTATPTGRPVNAQVTGVAVWPK